MRIVLAAIYGRSLYDIYRQVDHTTIEISMEVYRMAFEWDIRFVRQCALRDFESHLETLARTDVTSFVAYCQDVYMGMWGEPVPLEVREVIVRLIDREGWISRFDLSYYHLLSDDWDWYRDDKTLLGKELGGRLHT